jgi:hypothetical protein
MVDFVSNLPLDWQVKVSGSLLYILLELSANLCDIGSWDLILWHLLFPGFFKGDIKGFIYIDSDL